MHGLQANRQYLLIETDIIIWPHHYPERKRPIGLVIEHFLQQSVSLCVSVCQCVCPVHCGKIADRIWTQCEIVGRIGPGMKQVVGFGKEIIPREGVILGANLVCPIWGLDASRPLLKSLWDFLLLMQRRVCRIVVHIIICLQRWHKRIKLYVLRLGSKDR